MRFTILQAKLYYHLLKGEQLYRTWKSSHSAEAGLGSLAESVLAQRTWEDQKKFVAASQMRGSPLIPAPRHLQEWTSELVQAMTQGPKSISGVNIAGFEVESLEEHLADGVGGTIVAGPTGSRAVLWTDLASSGKSLRPGGIGLRWEDEFGQPLNAGFDLFEAPVVVDAQGVTSDKLFDALARAHQP
jgi:hypothetical protein